MAAPRKRAAAKTAKKTATVEPTLTPRPNGKGALLSGGKPGNKGGTGRPREEFREAMRALASEEAVLEGLRSILHNAADRRPFLEALKYATEYGYGKAATPVEVTGAEGGPQQMTVRFVHE